MRTAISSGRTVNLGTWSASNREAFLHAARIGFVTCVHPIHNLPSVSQHRDQAISGLRAAGCEVISPGIARDAGDLPEIVAELKRGNIDLLLFFFCTWVAEEITLSIAGELENIPLLLWALPYLDQTVPMPSPMTGLTAAGCNLKKAGRFFLHRVGATTPDQIQAVARTARIAAIVKGMRRTRFGIFGSPCPGMIDTVCDDSLLQRYLGITIVRRDLDSLLEAAQQSSFQEARRLAARLKERVGSSDVGEETIADQYRLYLGMKSLLEREELDGFSVRCWPELRDQHKHNICLAMSELAESGVPSACEADLTALVTSHILTKVAGQPACCLEITAFLEEQQALQLAHCGAAAISLTDDPRHAVIRTHMRTETGATLEFQFKPGIVTIAKLLRPAEGRLRMFVGRGEVIKTAPEARGSVATIKVEPTPGRFLESMLRQAVEHHLVLVYGDWTADLIQFTQLAGIDWCAPQ
jgi:L-fucose isomerase-like protein